MKVVVQHPTYGEIVYEEGSWSGKKSLTVNGVEAQPVSKKSFIINGKKADIKGNSLMGAILYIDDEAIELQPKPTWYEFVLAVLPFAFLMVWGNSAVLCSIFPVVGGAIGGGLGGAALVVSLLYMKKAKSPMMKVLIALGTLVATLLIAFVLALLIISAAATTIM